MASDPASPSQLRTDRFVRLRALQRPAISQKPIKDLQYDNNDRLTSGRCSGLPGGCERLAQLLDATVRQNPHGEHLSVHRCFEDQAPFTPDPGAMQLLLPDAPQEVSDPQRWLFLDTETTGLCGGSGTYPFLVGLGWWERRGIEVEQLFMRDLSEERSLLAALAERIGERPVIVTFNGKSFDWPLIETRYRMTRTLSVPKSRAHLDFLHPARNLWKLRLGSVRLSQLERRVLGWDRGEDMESGDIPRLYLDFLGGGPADPMLPIFLHNQLDIRGLAELARRVLSLLSEDDCTSEDGLELFGLSRICERRGQVNRARKMYEQSINSALPGQTDRAARAALARLAKRSGDYSRACELWKSILGNSREGYEAYEQLAIYYEHKARDPGRAVQMTRSALAQLRRANQQSVVRPVVYHRTKQGFEHRLARLERKLQATTPSMLESCDVHHPELRDR